MGERKSLIQKTDDNGCRWNCDNCGTIMNAQLGFTTATDKWTCTECGTVNDVSDDNIREGYVDIEDFRHKHDYGQDNECISDGLVCGSCQQSLRGGMKTLPWEDEDNAEEYIICPHCRCKNVVYDD